MYLHQVKALIVGFIVLLGVGAAVAQTGATGSILGSVKDASGAVIRDAMVIVTNTATGVESKAVTTSTGDYTVLNLIPGTYQVETQVSGFSKQVVNGIILSVNQQERVDLMLKTGGVTDVVQVQADAVALDTDNSSISQLVSHQQIVDLPLNGRNFYDLLSLGAGAVTTGGEQGSMRAGKGNAWSINGARPEATTYFLDGMLNTDQALNTPSVVLSIDAIQEFKVLSGTYSAQYGFGANQVSITSRAGTNSYHGTVFEFDRNDALDALSYLQTPDQKQKLRQNQFGGVLAGPVRIPFLYNGKDKTFFMANYEGIRQSTGGNGGFANVPLPSELAGQFDFSVKDPLTGEPFPGCDGHVSCIPTARFSRLATVTLANGFIPAPNCASCPQGNLRLKSIGTESGDQQTYRGDQNFGHWGSVFFRYTFDHFVTSAYSGVSGVVGGKLFTERDHNWVGSHTISLTPNLVNQFTFGRMEAYAVQSGTPVAQSVIDSLGFNGTFKTLTEAQRSYTNMNFTNNDPRDSNNNQRPDQNLGGFGGALNAYSYSDNPIWQFSDSISYLRGAHSLTIGAEYRPWHLVRDLATDFVGDINFSDYATGNQVGDFLLGTYSQAQSYIPGPFSSPSVAGNPQDHIFRYAAAYIQDDWKVSSKFTANLGLRWDFRTVPYETRNHMFWLDASNPNGGLCYADVALGTDGVAPAGNGFYRYCGSNSPGSSEKKNFAPRIGGAYRINNKTVLRAGYGLFWDGVEGREIDDSGDLYPYISRQSITQTLGQSTYATSDSLFPVVSTPGPVVAGPNGPDSFIAVIISENPKNPYVQDWSLSVERQLTPNTTVEMNYIGTKGTHLLSRENINQALKLTNPAACNVDPLPTSCTIVARRPYQNFATYLDSRWTAPSNYNALNVKAEHRQGNTTITSIYTWAKSMDLHSAAAGAGNAQSGWQGYLDNHNPRLDYGRSDFNVGQRFVTSFTYDIPVGRGKRFGGNMNKLADLAIGGWKTTGIATVQQGFPITVGANETGGLLDSFGVNRADQHGPAHDLQYSTDPTKVNAHNAALFTQPAFGTYGDSARNVATGPKYTNLDLGVKKAFAITERVNFAFQVDGFNAINHSLHNSPCLSPTCSLQTGPNTYTPAFGYLQGAAAKRILQLSGKISF